MTERNAKRKQSYPEGTRSDTERTEGGEADEGTAVSRDVEKEQELRNLFYDPMTGYQSRERLYQKAKESGLNVSRREVKEWLDKRHKFQKTYVNDLADQIQLILWTSPSSATRTRDIDGS